MHFHARRRRRDHAVVVVVVVVVVHAMLATHHLCLFHRFLHFVELDVHKFGLSDRRHPAHVSPRVVRVIPVQTKVRIHRQGIASTARIRIESQRHVAKIQEIGKIIVHIGGSDPKSRVHERDIVIHSRYPGRDERTLGGLSGDRRVIVSTRADGWNVDFSGVGRETGAATMEVFVDGEVVTTSDSDGVGGGLRLGLPACGPQAG